MKFVAPEQAPEQAEIIRNTPFWPDVDLSEFRSVMRTDGTVTQPRLKQVALSAISEVNAELYEFRRRQQMLGYASLAEVPAEQLDGKSERIQHYFNAVYCWARAMLNERYRRPRHLSGGAGCSAGAAGSDPSGILCAGYQNVIFRYGSSNSNQQRVVLAGWRTTGTAATRACFIGQRRRFTYCAVVVFAPHGITDGKCP